MNGPHLAPQLVLCLVLSLYLCLSLPLQLESCFLPGRQWLGDVAKGAKEKIKGEKEAEKLPDGKVTTYGQVRPR